MIWFWEGSSCLWRVLAIWMVFSRTVLGREVEQGHDGMWGDFVWLVVNDEKYIISSGANKAFLSTW